MKHWAVRHDDGAITYHVTNGDDLAAEGIDVGTESARTITERSQNFEWDFLQERWVLNAESKAAEDFTKFCFDRGWPLRPSAIGITWQDIRALRDKLLSDCDWTQQPDVSDDLSVKWRPLRLKLRNLPNEHATPSLAMAAIIELFSAS